MPIPLLHRIFKLYFCLFKVVRINKLIFHVFVTKYEFDVFVLDLLQKAIYFQDNILFVFLLFHELLYFFFVEYKKN